MKFSMALRAPSPSSRKWLAGSVVSLAFSAALPLLGQSSLKLTSRLCDDPSGQALPVCAAFNSESAAEQSTAEPESGGLSNPYSGSRNPRDYNSQLWGPSGGKPTFARKSPSTASAPAARGLDEEQAPEPLSEFQRFIASSVGSVLPIFGHDPFALMCSLTRAAVWAKPRERPCPCLVRPLGGLRRLRATLA